MECSSQLVLDRDRPTPIIEEKFRFSRLWQKLMQINAVLKQVR